ncbi:peptide MFS transporter [Flavobacterium sp. Fl-77]|uniref:Peptide MFS transporter n=1 Tax=Flavobacterium flavipigmentatum TaxID=2893884 RepID=A0AAJ2SEL8_9FLAO|nr:MULTISPECIES: peptide MFS transporter [unclassified Flavobacterium]MDX6181313.1 peptide MFS transporter [Flavobacterium sp. Fl-33]MDX6184914.1 peptide MFS transporter [Flavobacterium sp. Fl-77]UFH40007.1 peptide MFS transporter [Flavobacterium sp. F-70]
MEETQVKTVHPKGLWVLFGTEMWERFNFYGMRALLTLFLVNSLLMKEEEASLIYGGFLGLCYLTPMLGGFVADRFLGNRNCILLGGLLMAIGQLLLFTSGSIFDSNLSLAKIIMYCGLGTIVFGNGFFKPNISSMVGSLYPKQEKTKLDTAFTIFYMGINIGAFLGQSICPLLGDVVDTGGIRDIHAFKWGFLAASVAMLLGTLLFYVLKNKYVVSPDGRELGGLPSKNVAEDFEEGEAQKANFSNRALIGAGVAFFILGLFFHYVVGQNLIYTLIYSSGLALAGLIISDSSLTKIERDRIIVIYIVSFFIIFFWAAFEQAGSSLTFIANNQTDRNFFGWQMPPSMVQIFNGLFVVVLAVPFSILWDYLRAKSKEPISPVKLAIGLVVITVSFFMIATQVSYIGTSGLLLVKWLILLYFLNTCAELCLSPIGLSLVGKLSPKRFASLLFGVFFLSNASGYALGGTLGSILPPTGDKYKAAEKVNIDLESILENKSVANGAELFALAQLQIARIDKEKAKEFNLDVEKKIETIAEIKSQKEVAKKTNVKFVNNFTAKDTTFTVKELDILKEKNVITVSYPEFAGFTIHNLYEFFMVFVVLTGLAAIVLFALTPFLKKMMHGVR